ncbi:MAG: hypothetical protein IKR97_00410 [Eubacterium sp.]|nr:hypothetical protein [Eubacterium sp.]
MHTTKQRTFIPQQYVNSNKLTVEAQKVRGIEKLTRENKAKLVAYLLAVIHVTHVKGSSALYIYNERGFYEELQQWMLELLFKYLMDAAEIEWTPNNEGKILAEYKRSLVWEVDGFNKENAVNFRNGVFFLPFPPDGVKANKAFDLPKGRFEPHTPENSLFNSVLDYDYEPAAVCPKFDIFIRDTACGDKSWIDLVQEIGGICLSNYSELGKAFYFFGSGCNGKSVLARVLQSIIGEQNTCAISMRSLDEKFALAGLIGKKLNISSENEGMGSSERFKTLVTCDLVNIPVKYEGDWTGKLFAKHVFLMNSLPTTPDVTNGFFRRIVIVPFNNVVAPDQIDLDLPAKLHAERAGIFNWFYEGYCRLLHNEYRFTPCTSAEAASVTYMERENPTALFFRDCYEENRNNKVLKSSLYKKFLDWCEKNDSSKMPRNKFWSALVTKEKELTNGESFDFRRYKGKEYLVGYSEISKEDKASLAEAATASK